MSEHRVLLEALLEALNIPHPATVGDAEIHDRVLADRVTHAVIALQGALHSGDDPGWTADYLRQRLARHPATGYRAFGTPPTTGDVGR